MPDPEVRNEWGVHMIAKTEALQRLKKMGMTVADDASIVTVLLSKEVSFEAGLKDVRNALKELGYEASFCVKQSKDAATMGISSATDDTKGDDAKALEASGEFADETQEEASEETLSEEEINSYMVVDDDGQFSLGLEF